MAKPTKSQTLNDYPEYTAATAKLAELSAQYSQLDADITAARSNRAGPAGAPTRLEDQARAFLFGDGGGTAVAVTSLEAIDEMCKRRSVLKEAVRLQQQEIDKVRGQIGQKIARAALPEYEAILHRMAAALTALSETADAEAAFRDRFNSEGIAFASIIPPVPLQWARLSMYGTRANQWFDEAQRDYGIKCRIERQTSPGGPSA